MIGELISQNNGTLASIERIQKFVCVLHNGESFVTWQKDKDAAIADCERKHETPWKVLAYPAWI